MDQTMNQIAHHTDQQIDQRTNITYNPFKQDFPLLANNPQLSFLDSAATAQRPAVVLEAQKSFYETMNANPLRGLYTLSVQATQAIEKAREHVAHHIGAARAEEIVFTRNASESLNLIAQTLGKQLIHKGDEVVISIMEHHSNLIPWQQLCAQTGATLVYLRPLKDGMITQEQIDAAIGPKTKIVSITQVSNVLGVETPTKCIIARAHQMGAIAVVDGAQSVPHMQVNVQNLDCDLMVFSAHKALGPMGIGVLYGKLDILNAMPPFLTGGEMIDSVTETSATWAPVPMKFEAGTQDAAGIYAFDAALLYIEKIGMDVIEQRERNLAAYLCEQLNSLDFIDIHGPAEPTRHIGAVSFSMHGVHPHDVASILDMSNVAIRAGHHCAQPLLSWLGVDSTCRASIALYNDKNDIDQLIVGLQNVRKIFHAS
ncbi:aminotransferase class V-fold PLP-dependent enzyme [Atopobium fossor]|uniref:aminotransferase class V-fold PLP-dependent enzyme n=1 Tax=Atopobium fossor TaxID=39487 RepID=UPI0004210F54